MPALDKVSQDIQPETQKDKKKTSIWSNTSHGTVSSEYTKTYTSYSGQDMVAVFEIPLLKGSITHVVGELQTISYSMYNEKMPVRVLGDMNLKSIVFGNRTIAGSMVFTVFDRHWAHKMLDQYLAAMGSNAHILTDELPPINITISMSNEYGDKSRLALYGVTFVMEGQTMSVNDMYTENTFEYMAKDVDYLTTVVDANAASKGKSLSSEYTKKLKKDVSKINETPVDIPEKQNNPPANQKPKNEKTTVTLHVSFSGEDIRAGREHCIAKADKAYTEALCKIQGLNNTGKISQEEFVRQQAALKKSWQNCRKQVDAIFAKKQGGAKT